VSARQPANGRSPPTAPAEHAPTAPGPSTALRRCACGAVWLDDEPGRHAHRAVFGHQPRPREPAETPQQEKSP
jgi:hypothetical protein